MQKLNSHKVGLALGALVGVVHLVWAILVAVGWASGLVNFSLRLHFIDKPMAVLPFSFGSAILLIVIASVVGYIIGRIFSSLWNKFTI